MKIRYELIIHNRKPRAGAPPGFIELPLVKWVSGQPFGAFNVGDTIANEGMPLSAAPTDAGTGNEILHARIERICHGIGYDGGTFVHCTTLHVHDTLA